MRPSSRLATLVIALAAPALAGAATSGEPAVYCGDDFWFELREPEGWSSEWNPTGEAVGLAFRPRDGREMAIDVLLPLRGQGTEPVDVERTLHRWVGVMNVFGSAREMRPFDFSHPSLPSAGVKLLDSEWNLYAVAVDARSGRGNAFLASLTVSGAPASDAALATFGETVRSLRFDPGKICEPGPDGESVTREITPPTPKSAAAAPAPPEAGFDLERAALGCALLSELFVPIQCGLADVDGGEAMLVRFDGDEPPSAYIGQHAERVAVPFCHEARRHRGAPALFFGQDRPGQLREYRCDPQGWSKPIQPTRVDER